jgi:hypothetical protein
MMYDPLNTGIGSLQGDMSPGTLNPYGGPFGGGTQGGIMDALNPHKRNLYSTYNPKKVDRFYKRVQQMSDRFFPGYAGGGGPEIIY